MRNKAIKNIISTLCFSAVLLCLNPCYSSTKDLSIDIKDYGIYISNISVNELEEYYKKFGYVDYIYMPDWQYPPIFLNEMPKDFSQIEDASKKNNLFLRIIAPIALKINQDIKEEQHEIIYVLSRYEDNKEFSKEDMAYLDEKAKKYDIFTTMQGNTKYELYLEELHKKVDIIPPSILIGIAAIETNWGTSSSLELGNSLYKEKSWYTNEGLIPEGETEDPNYRIKTFNSLYDSMYSFALKINSFIDYTDFRFTRLLRREKNDSIHGRFAAHSFITSSPLHNYAGLLDYTITFYDLINFDADAELGFPEEGAI